MSQTRTVDLVTDNPSPKITVASTTERLALNVRRGQLVDQVDGVTSVLTTWVLRREPASVPSNWIKVSSMAPLDFNSSNIENLSTVPGATVTDALDTLQDEISDAKQEVLDDIATLDGQVVKYSPQTDKSYEEALQAGSNIGHQYGSAVLASGDASATSSGLWLDHPVVLDATGSVVLRFYYDNDAQTTPSAGTSVLVQGYLSSGVEWRLVAYNTNQRMAVWVAGAGDVFTSATPSITDKAWNVVKFAWSDTGANSAVNVSVNGLAKGYGTLTGRNFGQGRVAGFYGLTSAGMTGFYGEITHQGVANKDLTTEEVMAYLRDGGSRLDYFTEDFSGYPAWDGWSGKTGSKLAPVGRTQFSPRNPLKGGKGSAMTSDPRFRSQGGIETIGSGGATGGYGYTIPPLPLSGDWSWFGDVTILANGGTNGYLSCFVGSAETTRATDWTVRWNSSNLLELLYDGTSWRQVEISERVVVMGTRLLFGIVKRGTTIYCTLDGGKTWKEVTLISKLSAPAYIASAWRGLGGFSGQIRKCAAYNYDARDIAGDYFKNGVAASDRSPVAVTGNTFSQNPAKPWENFSWAGGDLSVSNATAANTNCYLPLSGKAGTRVRLSGTDGGNTLGAAFTFRPDAVGDSTILRYSVISSANVVEKVAGERFAPSGGAWHMDVVVLSDFATLSVVSGATASSLSATGLMAATPRCVLDLTPDNVSQDASIWYDSSEYKNHAVKNVNQVSTALNPSLWADKETQIKVDSLYRDRSVKKGFSQPPASGLSAPGGGIVPNALMYSPATGSNSLEIVVRSASIGTLTPLWCMGNLENGGLTYIYIENSTGRVMMFESNSAGYNYSELGKLTAWLNTPLQIFLDYAPGFAQLTVNGQVFSPASPLYTVNRNPTVLLFQGATNADAEVYRLSCFNYHKTAAEKAAYWRDGISESDRKPVGVQSGGWTQNTNPTVQWSTWNSSGADNIEFAAAVSGNYMGGLPFSTEPGARVRVRGTISDLVIESGNILLGLSRGTNGGVPQFAAGGVSPTVLAGANILTILSGGGGVILTGNGDFDIIFTVPRFTAAEVVRSINLSTWPGKMSGKITNFKIETLSCIANFDPDNIVDDKWVSDIDDYFLKPNTNSGAVALNPSVFALEADLESQAQTLQSQIDSKVSQSQVLQTVGSSTAAVMSQKAVTDLLNVKVGTASVVSVAGTSSTNVISQAAITNWLFSDSQNLVLGPNAYVPSGITGAVALGSYANVNVNNGTAVGDNAYVGSQDSVAIGCGSKAKGYMSVAVGFDSEAYYNCIAIRGLAEGENSVSLGGYISYGRDYSVAIGYGADVSTSNRVSFGNAFDRRRFLEGISGFEIRKADGSSGDQGVTASAGGGYGVYPKVFVSASGANVCSQLGGANTGSSHNGGARSFFAAEDLSNSPGPWDEVPNSDGTRRVCIYGVTTSGANPVLTLAVYLGNGSVRYVKLVCSDTSPT